MTKKKELELYLHIPFCVRKCAYCDFLSFSSGKDKQREYMERLLDEIHVVGEQCREYRISTIFVGGGTPSSLDSKWIVEMMKRIRERFVIAEGAEISLEANPGTVTEEKLSDYRRAGINRLSFGLQSADNRELSLLGRIHTWEEFLESFHMARQAGFANLNVDLMSGLPGQSLASWKETIKKTAGLEPEHISAYSLILEEGTPFFERYSAGGPESRFLPDEDTEREMYHQTRSLLGSFGYERYEISNYARPGKECLHNLGYWTDVPYRGLGLGASSYMEGERFCNESDLGLYLKGSFRERKQVQRLTKKEQQEEFFFVGLRLVRGVSLKEFERRFGVPATAVYPGVMERFVREGAARLENGWFKLTELGLDVSNYVMRGFLQE
ncbi:MAG: radical SAM family heme chaperone HemW [Lachnospiraceae bacterium]|nr:radical SAM family heme chaperone HemW [Lachnospiraceae bacterium]